MPTGFIFFDSNDFLWICVIVSGRQSATTVGHNDGSSKVADWLIILRWAQRAASDWLDSVFGILPEAGGGSPAGFRDRQSVC